ncbi:MAG: alpha/beta fold hydrolase [Gammaproteobacteria bacterium]|nr:alpha/beta fold hydrolase [Gammaproteobacteria bacterium]MBL6998567.1 alpha/beta fold hydrolase [Gammaproteobacteria bacterium]
MPNRNKTCCVILLHGLARTPLSMQAMEYALQKQGYSVVNVSYPSRQLPVADLAIIAIEHGLQKCRQQNTSRIHIVTHSLGGILVRHYARDHAIAGLARVVMLGPPNQGSQVVDKLKKMPGFAFINGPAGLQLGTRPEDIPKQLGPVNFELGVIAGEKSFNPLLSTLIPGRNDGKVSIEGTKIDGMRDFICLPVSHTFMMRNPETIRQTLHFLQHGSFDHTN